jgi:DNA-binding GntR family transcriptional regulator
MAGIPAGRGIDKTSFEPAYIQLVNVLRRAIASGQYQAGDQLPTEAELCAAYDVSPMTVRRAIGMLLDQGAVTTTRGRGTFVQPLRLATATFDLSEFHDILAEPEVTAKVVEARVLPAGPRAAANLGLADGTRVVSIRRILQRGDEPLIYHRESLVYDPTLPTIESELDVTALRDMFEGGAGSGPKRGELILHASVLSYEEGGRLGLPAGTAAWVLEHIFYDYDEKPISWGCFICRGDLFSFRAGVGAQAPEPEASTRRTPR